MSDWMLITLGVLFLAQLALGVPVAFAVLLASFAALCTVYPPFTSAQIVAQKSIMGINSFALLAVPFFILAGNIMNNGGIAERLIALARLIAGRLPGSLAHCNVIANMLFGSVSGSAVASAAAIGGVMHPMQTEEGYDARYAAAVNIASAPAGLLIPPSGVLILFSLVSGGTSVSALFLAGYLPGLMLGLGLMLVIVLLARSGRFNSSGRPARASALTVVVDAIPSLLLIVLIMGGIVSGVFTATEASAVAVIYALLLSLAYRQLNRAMLYRTVLQSAITSCMVLFLVGASSALSWVLALGNLPELISGWFAPLMESPLLVLLIMNLILIVVGTFLDLTPAVLIFTPVFLPLAIEIGIHPVHFGIMLVFNLCIGICTPPVGSALFVGASVSRLPVVSIIKPLVPMYLMLALTLALVVAFPALSLWLPTIAGAL